MLNELSAMHRGAIASGIDVSVRHPDIKDSRNIPTFVVGLEESGAVHGVRLKPDTLIPWTLRDGMHNSFPFVQIKSPLRTHDFSAKDDLIVRVMDRRNANRRNDFLDWIKNSSNNETAFASWPGSGLLGRIADRLNQTASLIETKSKVVPLTMQYFISACDSVGSNLLETIASSILDGMTKSADDNFLESAICLLLGKYNQKTSAWENQAGLLFEAFDCEVSIADSRLLGALSGCLNAERNMKGSTDQSICAITGKSTAIIKDKFPQPNLRVLGQTYLFAKNSASKANFRYGRSSVEAMSVGIETADALSAVFVALTQDERLNITWRPLPGESPNQTDLLLAYVVVAPDTPMLSIVADESEFDDDGTDGDAADPIADYETRTKRIFDSLHAKVGADYRTTPVSFNVFRKIDPANRKVVYGGLRSVGNICDAAFRWAEGERNLPHELTLLAKFASKKSRKYSPPHIAPLGLIAFSKKLFARGGVDSSEVPGLPASEVMTLFLRESKSVGDSTFRHNSRVLRLVLARRSELCISAAHRLRKNDLQLVGQQNREALRTCSVIGVLLNNLGRKKERYMEQTAFKLGQLLAGADSVHAGYCADVRNGSVPPSLLGNQLFGMAQSSPSKALAVWCRRWKPYDGWAQRLQRNPKEAARVEGLKSSQKKEESQRGWEIKKALRIWRDMKPIAESLRDSLNDCKINDTFKAELLLGYMTGIPSPKQETE